MSPTQKLPPQVNWEDVPRWYGFSYRAPTKTAPPAIVFLVRRGCRDIIAGTIKRSFSFEEGGQKYGSLLFETDILRGFGFDGIIRCEGEADGYVRLVMPLDSRYSMALCAESYSLLLQALNYMPGVRTDSDATRVQLFQLETSYSAESNGFHGAPMGGKSAPALRRWMEKRRLKHPRLRKVEAALCDSYLCLSDFVREERISKSSLAGVFSAHIGEKGIFGLNTLGNACDVSTMDGWRVEDNHGHRLGCHNLDTALQQVSLLAGFAALHDMAANALDPH